MCAVGTMEHLTHVAGSLSLPHHTSERSSLSEGDAIGPRLKKLVSGQPALIITVKYINH